jgi:CO/xanthine dehydrogenase Mo-binding subunit
MAIPALLSRKANAPVMMRISREEESYIGRARTNMTGRVRMGFRKDGRITALDLYIVQDSGAYGPMGDHRSAGNAASLIYQPQAMRWRTINVLTNTPPSRSSPRPRSSSASTRSRSARSIRRRAKRCLARRFRTGAAAMSRARS